ncbi:MAG TPA: threonine synthase [Candidatus Cloacimonadota bacterium]|nr:threonine synthase [Candidatus Cloacimonadota bacterium]
MEATLFQSWVCTTCGKTYARDEVRYLCPSCAANYRPGMPLVGVLEAFFCYDSISWEVAEHDLKASKEAGIRQFIDLFSAVDPRFYPALPVGMTPFFRLKTEGNLWLKNDSLNPSGSFKDRASQLVVAEAIRLGIKEIVCASTGNAASSLSAYCASAGIKAVIFAPAAAPQAKLVQIQVHGAELHKIDGTYDDAFKAALDYSATHECLNRNTAYHPLTIEGKKTSGLEIFAQNGYKAPDWIVIPVGDGVILSGIHKAFIDLQRAELCGKMPRLLAVQAENSDAITSYWESGTYHDSLDPVTIADSISVTTPSNAHWAVKAINETRGKALRVTDAEIRAAQRELAARYGIFAEPSSSATLAGLRKAQANNWITDDEQVVLLITGHGLKDIKAVAHDN